MTLPVLTRRLLAVTPIDKLRPVLGVGVGESIRRFAWLQTTLARHGLFALWAEPVTDGARIHWYTELPGDIRTYAELPPDVQEKTRRVLRYYVDAVDGVMARHREATDLRPVIDACLDVPSLGNVFLVGYRPVLILWGYTFSDAGAPRGLIRKLTRTLEPPRLMANVKIIEADTDPAQPIEGATVQLHYEDQAESLLTNEAGNVSFRDIAPYDYPHLHLTAEAPGYTRLTGELRLDRAIAELIWTGFTPLITTLRLHPAPPPPPSDLQGQRGALSVNLRWQTPDDLDLFVTDPAGNLIWFRNRTATCEGCVGTLDVDANAQEDALSDDPQENIFWDRVCPGAYTVEVVLYRRRTAPTAPVRYVVTIIQGDDRLELPGEISTEKERQFVTTIEL
jgi:hypothetical protein